MKRRKEIKMLFKKYSQIILKLTFNILTTCLYKYFTEGNWLNYSKKRPVREYSSNSLYAHQIPMLAQSNVIRVCVVQ